MKLTKRIFSFLLALSMILGLLPITAAKADGDYVYLSISFDGKYIDDKNGNPIVYLPVPLADIAAVDLTEYGLDNMLLDADGDGSYETTALQLLIYAHEELYGGDWGDVNFDALPGSSYFRGGIFGFTENLVYFHNGDFPVDETQQSDFMTVGATSDRIVLEAGDFLDVASFSCYSFLWDMDGGFHLFSDPEGNYVHDYAVNVGETLPIRLLHSFCDLMFGEAWVKDAVDYEVYYGTTFGEAEGTVTTDDSGCAEVSFPTAGTYYLWCDGANSEDYGTHGSCDYCLETDIPCIVSAPAYAKVTVTAPGGQPEPEAPANKIEKWNITLTDALQVNFHLSVDETIAPTTTVKIVAGDTVTTHSVADLPKTESGLYVASVKMAAAQMADDIVVFLLSNNQILDSSSYTIRQYVDAVLADASLRKYHTLVTEMLNYGAAAQVYFDYHKETLANAGITGSGAANIPADLDQTVVVDGAAEGVTFYGSSLSFRNKIALRYYFRFCGDITQYAFRANGTTLTPSLKDGLYYVEIPDISPENLDRDVTLEITDPAGAQLTVRYSPVNYIARMSQSGSAPLQALVKALYQYHLAAKAVA